MATAPCLPSDGVYDVQVRDATGEWVVFSAHLMTCDYDAAADPAIASSFSAGFQPIVICFVIALGCGAVLRVIRDAGSRD